MCLRVTLLSSEREYRCLGQWSEGEVTYTYTERRDKDSYECFAGVVVTEGEVLIMEAGDNCQRGMPVLDYGMKLLKQSEFSATANN